MDEWVRKICYVYYSAIRMKQILSFAIIWVYLEDIMPSVISQTEKKILIPYNPIYMWNLKRKNIELIKTESRWMVTRS